MTPEKDPTRMMLTCLRSSRYKADRRLSRIIGHLGTIRSVKYDDSISSACIERYGKQYQIRFSRKFIRTYVSNHDDLLFVLLHEIYHKINGDLIRELNKRANKMEQLAANITADILINSQILSDFFGTTVPLLTKLYCGAPMPTALLITSVDVIRLADQTGKGCKMDSLPGAMEVFLRNLGVADRDILWLANWYCDAWRGNTSFDSLYKQLAAYLLKHEYDQEILFLGNHDNPEKVSFPEEWSESFGKWGGHSDQGYSRSAYVENKWEPPRQLLEQIRKCLDADPLLLTPGMSVAKHSSPVPGNSRRDALFLSAGYWPALHDANISIVAPVEERLHLYMDVSASMDYVLPFVWGLLCHLDQVAGSEMYLFSNQIHTTSLKELEEGCYKTTGGTDYDCVLAHCAKFGYRKIVIVTDGLADASPYWIDKIQRLGTKIVMILTDQGQSVPESLSQFVTACWHLPSGHP